MKTGVWPHVVLAVLLALIDTKPALAADCPDRGFVAGGTFRAGTIPSSVAVRDFNRDGRPDLAVANEFSSSVSILLGRGDGTFNNAVDYNAGSAPSAVATGDFNGDQRIDLAVANAGSTNVAVLIGNGDGSFRAPVGYGAGQVPRSVTVADFNGDGSLDLALANRLSADVSVLLGRGNGTFQSASSHPAGTDPVSVVAGDFNGDMKVDLTVANAALFSGNPSVSVLVARATTGFRNAVNYSAGVSPRAIAVRDFNRDGRLDLAVANFGGFVGSQFTNGSVSVLLGVGDGTFQEAVNYRAGDGPISLMAADFNRNGEIDLAVANNRSSTVSVLSGRGDGTFGPAINYGGGPNPRSVAAGDFNEDGALDLVVANDAGALVLVNICLTNTDLAITMDATNEVAAGDRLIYTLTVTNVGPVAAPDTSLVDQLPIGVSFVSVTSSHGSCAHSSGTVNCNLGTIEVGATATVTISVSATSAGNFTNAATVISTATIDPTATNNSATVVTTVLPLVSLATSDSSASETGPNSGAFTFRRSGSMSEPLTVYYTVGGSASNGVDYIALSGVATIPSGVSSVILTVTPVDELVVEPSETVNVTIVPDAAYFINPSASSAAFSIIDNDAYKLSINDVSLTETNDGALSAVFTVSLSYPNAEPITVNYFTADDTAIAGSDYEATNGTLVFPPGTTNQSVTVAIVGDELNEADETFHVNLFNATNAVVIDFTGTGTINNDDPLPSLSISDVTVAEGDSGRTNAIFNVSLSAVSGQTVTVKFATTNLTASAGLDYVPTNGTLAFTPGVLTQAITVAVNGDLLNESDETFLVNLSGATNAVVGDGEGVGTISNDDPLPALTINDVAVTEGDGGGTNATFTVSLSPVSGQNVTVEFATADDTAVAGTDYVAMSGVVSFAPGTATQTVTVRVIGDQVNEVVKTFFVILSNPVNVLISDGLGAATILDDDPPELLLSTALVHVPEGSTNFFAVRLNGSPPETVIVTTTFISGDANLVLSVGTNLTFDAANWDVDQTVVISAAEDDDLLDGQSSFTISGAGFPDKTLNAVGLDNDLPNLSSCLGDSATFGATAFGAGPFTYSWSKDRADLPDQTNSSIVLTNVILGDSGTYSVHIDSPSYTLKKSGTLVVKTPVNVTALTSLTNCPGTQATFSTTASGDGPLTYRWSKDGSELIGQTNSSLEISHAGASDAGIYTVEVTGACGTGSSSATLTLGGESCFRIMAIELAGSDVIISFTTVSNQYYRVERASDGLEGNLWSVVADDVPGTGGIVQERDIGGTGHASRFYRIVLLPDKVPPGP